MLHVELVLQLSETLCCTWNSSCNFRRHYVARGPALATFEGSMLHVDLVLQLSESSPYLCVISLEVINIWFFRMY